MLIDLTEVDINAVDEFGCTPLIKASASNASKSAHILINAKRILLNKKRNKNALVCACKLTNRKSLSCAWIEPIDMQSSNRFNESWY